MSQQVRRGSTNQDEWTLLMAATASDRIRWRIDTTTVGRSAMVEDAAGVFWQIYAHDEYISEADLCSIYQNALRKPGETERLLKMFVGSWQDPWVMAQLHAAVSP